MAAALLLVMLATVGIDYGWQPDGTKSPQGDNIEYIIQIPPDQLDEVKKLGEITSTLDPTVANRVVKVIVRVGTEPLPRNAGNLAARPTLPTLSRSGQSSLGADTVVPGDQADHSPLPIPEFPVPEDLVNGPGQPGRSTTESLMKPDPQSGGFALPPSTLSPVGTNPNVSTEPVETERENRWADIRGQAGLSAPAASTARVSPPSPTTTPVAPSENWTLPPVVTTTAPGTNNSPASNWNTSPAATVSSQPITNQSAGAASSSDLTTMAQPSGSRQPTNPNDPTWSGYGTTPTFGTPPAGIAPPHSPATAAGRSPSTALGDYPQQSAVTATSATPGFTKDAMGNLLDRLGRHVDSQGRLIDPKSGNLIDAAGNWVDQYGRRIDQFGRTLPGEASIPATQGSGAATQPTTPINSNAPLNYGSTNHSPAYEQFIQGQPAPTQSPFPHSGPGYASPGQGSQTGSFPGNFAANGNYPGALGAVADGRPWQQSTWGQGQSGFGTTYASNPAGAGSPSGWQAERDGTQATGPMATSGTSAGSKTTSQGGSDGGRQRTVSAQPFFNFILLISLVGNAYLIFETGNLRRKFRSMIASVRANKVSAQPAN